MIGRSLWPMDGQAIEAALAAVERELAAGREPDLRALRFWRAVDAVKRDRALVPRYAERIARLDRDAFVRAVPLRLPAAAGIVLLVIGLAIGLAFVAIAPSFDHPWRELAFLVALGALDLTTHGLAHLVVGAAVGIRFTDSFVDLPSKPQPGLKVDYASYLRAPARARAWMHASGAIVTKIVPFPVLALAFAAGADAWALIVIAVIGLAQIATDVLFSVKTSDWKKFRREMALAR